MAECSTCGVSGLVVWRGCGWLNVVLVVYVVCVCRTDERGSRRAVYSQHIKSADSAASTDGGDSHRSSLSRM